jgi:Zn-dependent M16 (insulinase) family peptidase
MTIVHGFELLRDQYIAEFDTRAGFYRHVKTGAELLSLINNDENKVFGIVFRTPPADSTGVAHILEHAVLCGSRKYPLKEPFVELLKGSLKTFLNAFTYPDKTCYPVASQNARDFYNLIDVYLDAVFYPRITPHVLQQEGWHFELDDPNGPLSYKGVVFNEMKGVYSSPDSVLSEITQQSLFPDNTYGLDSGGNPAEIPNLTFEQFKAFHQKHYHPSNARIFFYGDDDPEERLRIVNEYLDGFERMEIDSRIHPQPCFGEPKRVEHPFAAGKGDDGDAADSSKGMVTVNWLLTEEPDAETSLALQILHYALLGMPGSPLRKALIDSGLGDDLAGVGLETDLRQIYFSTGMKGVEPKNGDRVEALILEVLTSLAREGIDPQTVEAALNSVEFMLRENNSGSYPRGLVLMLHSLTTWLYDRDPLALLAFEAPLAAIKSGIASKKNYLEDMIDRFLLKNTHRTTVILTPDSELEEKAEAAEKERLEEIRRSMSSDELQKIIENARELRRRQETPDSPEALAAIPTLKIEDLEKKNKPIPLALLEQNGVRTLYHDIFTNRITYLDLAFDLHSLDREYLPYVRLFGRSLTEMGTEREDFVSLTQRISQKTGGIRPEIFTSSIRGSEKSAAWLLLRGKSMVDHSGDLLEILKDVLLTTRFDNRERFKQMVLEEKARQERKLVPSGHMVVNQRLRAHFSEADWATEQIQGISYLMFIRKLARAVDEDWKSVLETLEAMRKLLVNRSGMLLNVTLDEPNWKQWESAVSEFLGRLPLDAAQTREWLIERPPAHEGLIIPSLVNYVGKGVNLNGTGYSENGSTLVITGYLRNSWLWDRVRVQGGAYGAMCLMDRHSGTLTFVSYRDPNLIKTLENFDQTTEFLRNTRITEAELTKGIIGTIGSIDAYLLPDAKGYVSMVRALRGETEESLQRMRDEVLATRSDDFKAFADVLEHFRNEGIVKVLGSQSALEQTASDRPGWLSLLKVL